MSLANGLAHLKIIEYPIYFPIASHDGMIRVLDLQPGQFAEDIIIYLNAVHIKGHPTPSYEALSYVWGVGASTSRAWIGDKNGPSLPITANLESALRHIRRPDKPRTLWIDALCINQMDFKERGAQVQLMGNIYTAADNVLIWLGPENNDTDFKHGLTLLQDGKDLSESDLLCLAPTMHQILGRSWFERTWVVQELALSKRDPLVLVGGHHFLWQLLLKCAAAIGNRLDRISGIRIADFQERHERASSFNSIRLAKRNPDRQDNAFFAYQLRRTLYLSATDPRDKVFGLLEISDFESERLLADYTKPLPKVFTEATAYMLRNGYVSMYFESPLRPVRDQHVRLGRSSEWPTWVPNFAFATKTKANDRSFNAARRSYNILLEPPMDNLPLMLNIKPEERVDMLAQELPSNLPAAQISADFKRLSTYGLFAGTIIATSKDSLRHLEWTEPHWLSLNSIYDVYHDIVAPNRISSADYLVALLPQEHTYIWRVRPGAQQHEFNTFDLFLNANRDRVHDYGDLFRPRHEVNPGPFGRRMHDTMQELAEAISSRAKDRIVFVTDQGHVGLTYHEDPQTGIRSGDVLVGLFGVNFPFILRRNESAGADVTYEMINAASVANHPWGHDFLGNIFTLSGYPEVKAFGQDVTWANFGKAGLKEYVII